MGTQLTELQHKVDILALNRLKVYDENGKEVLISSFWKEKPVVIIFIRHFSCLGCRAHVDNVWQNREKFRKANTDIVFVGSGGHSLIKDFKADVGVMTAQVFTDPSLKTFDAAGMVRGITNLLDPRGVKNMVSLAMQGYKPGNYKGEIGSHTQMGGVVGLKPPGKVVYHFISDYVGDTDKPEDGIQAVSTR